MQDETTATEYQWRVCPWQQKDDVMDVPGNGGSRSRGNPRRDRIAQVIKGFPSMVGREDVGGGGGGGGGWWW
jgi:hypothetical protein